MKRIAVIPGDGIGPEVLREAVRVLKHLQESKGLELEFVDFDWGAEKFLREGVTLPEGALEMLTAEFDAILAGAFGDPRVASNKHAEDILLGMRRGLDLYINLRPVRLLHDRLTPLANRKTSDIDFVVFRENTEGAYCASGGFLKQGTTDAIALFMVLDPSQYDVIVSNNLFGDILTDLGAAIQGGLGLAASGNIHPGRVSLFEPVHGSAPPLAGKGIANPIGAILTSAMMLEYLGFQTLSDEIEEAVRGAVSANETTRDLGGQLSTEQAGAAIIKRLAN